MNRKILEKAVEIYVKTLFQHSPRNAHGNGGVKRKKSVFRQSPNQVLPGCNSVLAPLHNLQNTYIKNHFHHDST
jgi:hypothetical protein